MSQLRDQILELLRDLQREFGTAIVLITHDLGVVADVADEVAVMYGARVVENGAIDDIFYRPEMPYTLGLLASVPRLNRSHSDRLDPIPGNPPSPIRVKSSKAVLSQPAVRPAVTRGVQWASSDSSAP